jgi:hypothetical protein
LEFSWNVGFDFHFGNSTKNGWRSPIYWNDIGVDYFLQAGISDIYWSGLSEQLSAGGLRRLFSPYATVKGNKVTFDFSFPSIANVPTEFSWMVMTRKITRGGAFTGLFYADKAPIKGHYESGSFTTITTIIYTYSSGSVTSVVTKAIGTQTPTLQLPLVGSVNMSTLQQAAGAAATGGAAVFGYFLKTSKRRFTSNYLKKINSTCSEHKDKPEECKTELSRMKDEILHLLETGKIDETHFTILDARLTERLRQLN